MKYPDSPNELLLRRERRMSDETMPARRTQVITLAAPSEFAAAHEPGARTLQ